MVQRSETTVGPVAVDGRTITLVARTRAVRVGNGNYGAVHVRARPTHVEVLDEDGRRSVVRIRDVESWLLTTVAMASVGYVIALRALRKARSR